MLEELNAWLSVHRSLATEFKPGHKYGVKHGHSSKNCTSPTYYSWKNMKARCLYKAKHNFYLYGGRGITYCQRWHAFENFLQDMGERPSGTTLDRIDNNGNYETINCRWATSKEQGLNRRGAYVRKTK